MAENLETVRALLVAERDQLVVRIDELTAGGEIELDFDDDFADRAQVAGEKGENLTLADRLQAQLALVTGAIARVDAGTYGVCDTCGDAIGAERLEALPATNRCIAHA